MFKPKPPKDQRSETIKTHVTPKNLSWINWARGDLTISQFLRKAAFTCKPTPKPEVEKEPLTENGYYDSDGYWHINED